VVTISYRNQVRIVFLVVPALAVAVLAIAGSMPGMPRHQQPFRTIPASMELGASPRIPGTFALLGSAQAPAIPGTAATSTASATPAGGATSSAPDRYKNPIGPGLTPERVDMGVDYGGTGPVYALGNGTITNVWNPGWPGGVFIGLQLSDGSGRYIYYAENISPAVQAGQAVTGGQLTGYATGGGIEVGWAAPPGTGQTMADLTGQDKAGLAQGDAGDYPTGYGANFSSLVSSLGGPAGIISGPVQGTQPR
jgi:hypothetical protein